MAIRYYLCSISYQLPCFRWFVGGRVQRLEGQQCDTSSLGTVHIDSTVLYVFYLSSNFQWYVLLAVGGECRAGRTAMWTQLRAHTRRSSQLVAAVC